MFPTYTVTDVNRANDTFDVVEASDSNDGTPTLSQGSGKWEFYVARPHKYVVGFTFTPSQS